MIPLPRLPLVVILGLIAAALVGLLFAELTPAAGVPAPANLLIVAIELLLYLLTVVLSNPEIGGGRGMVISSGMLLARWILCLPAATPTRWCQAQ